MNKYVQSKQQTEERESLGVKQNSEIQTEIAENIKCNRWIHI